VIAAGADGFLTKSAIASELIPAVEAMRRGERFVTSKS
jgi:DNA-binding NarL/FixJ family response regulator